MEMGRRHRLREIAPVLMGHIGLLGIGALSLPMFGTGARASAVAVSLVTGDMASAVALSLVTGDMAAVLTAIAVVRWRALP